MNAPHPLQVPMNMTQAHVEDDEELNMVEYWDIIVDNRWLIALAVLLALGVGGAYALLAKPIYEANLLVQVEDSGGGAAKSFLGEAASLFDVKTPAAAEIEIMRSRMIVGQAVDNTLLYIDARPRYVPFVGHWQARKATSLSEPGLLGWGGFVSGTENVRVTQFNVPQALEGTLFRLTALGNNRFAVSHPELKEDLQGTVGGALVRSTPAGTISLLVNSLNAKGGAQFELIRHSRLATIEDLQSNLALGEKGRQSGVISATLRNADPDKLTRVLNEIGRQYVRQNLERRSAEAHKTLAFLEGQLPQFKQQLDASEAAYNRYRNQQGTVALDEEAKLILAQAVELQGKLLEAQQKRRELVARFTAEHPAVKTVDDQIAAWSREIGNINSRVKNMPSTQQAALRLERDVKVSNELYQSLRNNALQLQLVREGKIGNVRLIDEATIPEKPVQPKRAVVFAAALFLGLVGGVVLALTRNAFFRGIRNPQEIEAHIGLNVYSTVPVSEAQTLLARDVAQKVPGVHLLAHSVPHDPVVESLRSLRTALQFAMLEAPNNRILITGATPGVGKSFVSANFAAVLASAGKRVLLIDADLRKGHLHQYFNTPRVGGLSELISATITAPEAIRRQLLPNVDLLTTGILPPNPAELMMSASLPKLLATFSGQYDVVLIDTAPVLAAADTLSVAPHVGTLLLVARADVTQIGEMRETAKRLAQAGRNVTGAIFNALDPKRRHHGSYRYGSYRYRQYRYEIGESPN